MRTIALVAPELHTFETAQAIFGKRPEVIHLALGLQEQGVVEAAKLVQRGIEIIISRGETARMIMAAFPDITVVAIKRSGFDIARALTRAKKHGEPIAAVSFPDSLQRITTLCKALGEPIAPYEVNNKAEADIAVVQAVNEGAKVIIGVASTVEAAQRHGIPCELVHSGVESILEAATEAHAILHARQLDKAKMSLLHTVLNATGEGIVAADSAGVVTVFNAVAERYLGHDARDIIGTPLADIWPDLNLDQTVRKGETEPYVMMRTKNKTLVCNFTPVKVDAEVKGVVATFHDANKIQAMEASVRRRIHASGHVASIRFQDIQGRSIALKQAISIGKDYAHSHATVLVTGETGTGKELFAQSIHNHSPRADGPFVAVNCAALPGNLLESELFGYVAGAFTGASNKGKPGLFELAHGGTILLDEITEMELAVQAKLLRVLQEKKVRRLGSDQIIPIDVRIIASTNKDIRKLADGSEFRTDLYYRLNVLLLRLPPLRERPDDIPLLCRYFLNRHTAPPADVPAFTQGALQLLSSYSWPGNVRELESVMSRILATVKEPFVSEQAVRILLGEETRPDKKMPPFVKEQVEEIRLALRNARGRREEAARNLGISRSTLWRKIQKYNL